jgi:hypothetical protein
MKNLELLEKERKSVGWKEIFGLWSPLGVL